MIRPLCSGPGRPARGGLEAGNTGQVCLWHRPTLAFQNTRISRGAVPQLPLLSLNSNKDLRNLKMMQISRAKQGYATKSRRVAGRNGAGKVGR